MRPERPCFRQEGGQAFRRDPGPHSPTGRNSAVCPPWVGCPGRLPEPAVQTLTSPGSLSRSLGREQGLESVLGTVRYQLGGHLHGWKFFPLPHSSVVLEQSPTGGTAWQPEVSTKASVTSSTPPRTGGQAPADHQQL